MELIDKEELLKRFEFTTTVNGAAIRYEIKYAPTVDAVPVVYCKDCKAHDNCFPENAFKLAKIENPFCCVGIRKEQAMTRYIDLDKLEKILDDTTTIDIVRCEDCRYAHSYSNTLRSVYCSMLGRTMGKDEYCSFGNREDD